MSDWVPRQISTIVATIDSGATRLTLYVQMEPPIHLERCPNIEQVLTGERDALHLPLGLTSIEYLPAADEKPHP